MDYFFRDVCLVTTILFLWFNTDAVIEYLKLFHAEGLISEYLKHSETPLPTYLFLQRVNYKNRTVKFILKLLSCPVCLGMILSVFIGLIKSDITYIPLIYIGAMITYMTLLNLKESI